MTYLCWYGLHVVRWSVNTHQGVQLALSTDSSVRPESLPSIRNFSTLFSTLFLEKHSSHRMLYSFDDYSLNFYAAASFFLPDVSLRSLASQSMYGNIPGDRLVGLIGTSSGGMFLCAVVTFSCCLALNFYTFVPLTPDSLH